MLRRVEDLGRPGSFFGDEEMLIPAVLLVQDNFQVSLFDERFDRFAVPGGLAAFTGP